MYSAERNAKFQYLIHIYRHNNKTITDNGVLNVILLYFAYLIKRMVVKYIVRYYNVFGYLREIVKYSVLYRNVD